MQTEQDVSVESPLSSDQAKASATRIMAHNVNTPDEIPSISKRLLLITCLTSSLLLFLCFFPVAWGWLGWVGLVPVGLLIRLEIRPLGRIALSYMAGVLFYFLAWQWVRVADDMMYITWFAVAFYVGMYFPIGFAIVRALERRWKLPLIVSWPLVWVALEYLRTSYIFGGTSWFAMGYTQHDALTLIQIADLGGFYFVSLLVVAANAIVLEWVLRSTWIQNRFANRFRPSPTGRVGLIFQTALLLLTIAGCFAYGSWRLQQQTTTLGPKLALIQGHVPQGIRNEGYNPDGEHRVPLIHSMQKHYLDLTIIARKQQPDIIIWPETSWPIEWNEASEELLSEAEKRDQALLREIPKRSGIPLLVGVNLREWTSKDKAVRYNSAMFFGPSGATLGRYDKIHRVPFGEYIPLRDTLPFLGNFAPYDYDYSIEKGQEFDRLPIGKHHFGVLICYEDTDPPLSRAYVRPGEKPADFLVNISNDGWFKGTAEHEEHLALCRFRAIECRRAVARSVNMGISALVDSNGQVLKPSVGQEWKMQRLWSEMGTNQQMDRDHVKIPVWTIPDEGAETLPVSEWHQFKSKAGVLLCRVPIDSRTSLYARWGDWLPVSCWLFLALFFLSKPVLAIVKKWKTHPGRENVGLDGFAGP